MSKNVSINSTMIRFIKKDRTASSFEQIYTEIGFKFFKILYLRYFYVLSHVVFPELIEL